VIKHREPKTHHTCTRCKKTKTIENFYRNRSWPNTCQSQCKNCSRLTQKEWVQNNKERVRETVRRYKESHPWFRTYVGIGIRCSKKDGPYFLKGIKKRITVAELKKIWFRDKAYNLKEPSIDRKNNEGNYTYINCRYIELKDNRRLHVIKVGAQLKKSTLTDKQVKDIRLLKKTNQYTVAQLARKFKVGWWAIKNIINRTTWKHVQ
jgi:hypothetical protein